MIVTAGVRDCFPVSDRRGVNGPDTWRNYIPKAIADHKIVLIDARQLSNPEKDRDNTDKRRLGRHPGIVDELLCSGTGMYLLQSTWEAIEKETKFDIKLVVIDFCNANRNRSVAKGTIMSCMLVEKGIEHGLLQARRDPPPSDGTVPSTARERPLWLSPAIESTFCSMMIPRTRLSLDWTTTRRLKL